MPSTIGSVFWGTLLALVALYWLRGETRALLAGPAWLANVLEGLLGYAGHAGQAPRQLPRSTQAPRGVDDDEEEDEEEEEDDDLAESGVESAPERFAMGSLKTQPAPL